MQNPPFWRTKAEGWGLLKLLPRRRKHVEYPYGSSVTPEVLREATGEEVYRLLDVTPPADTENAYAKIFRDIGVTPPKPKKTK